MQWVGFLRQYACWSGWSLAAGTGSSRARLAGCRHTLPSVQRRWYARNPWYAKQQACPPRLPGFGAGKTTLINHILTGESGAQQGAQPKAVADFAHGACFPAETSRLHL